MKYLETHFEDYVSSVKRENLHASLHKTYNYFPDNIKDFQNLIFYGPPGVGKYSQGLYAIQKYSSSDLKYERKIKIEYNRSIPYFIKISDIHFEVDMALLGCNAKILWNTIYYQILDILSTRQSHTGIIFCKNFHAIHSELLDIFYSYIQTLSHKNIHLKYILFTEHLSFIPTNIINRVNIIHFSRPKKSTYNKCLKRNITNIKLSEICNIKNLHTNINQLRNPHKVIGNRIIEKLNNYNNLHFLEFREILYDLFIYHIDITECLWYILSYFINTNKITEDKLYIILLKLYTFLKFFNNNYRPIFHLENFMMYLCKAIHEF